MSIKRIGMERIRPDPPEHLIASIFDTLTPAPEVAECVKASILVEDGPLHNPDHVHLIDAYLCFTWASSAFNKQGRSFAYTVGDSAFRSSTLLKLHNQGRYREACEQMRRWVYVTVAGIKIKLRGLVNRRDKEVALCLSGID